jgi:hypothetical protein
MIQRQFRPQTDKRKAGGTINRAVDVHINHRCEVYYRDTTRQRVPDKNADPGDDSARARPESQRLLWGGMPFGIPPLPDGGMRKGIPPYEVDQAQWPGTQ